MRPTTHVDRRHELEALLAKMRDHPERDWSLERKRAAVLRQMLGVRDAAFGK